jgi:protein TonB
VGPREQRMLYEIYETIRELHDRGGDVMASTGRGSPRALGAGVATATLATMAGMVGALRGIFPATILSPLARHQRSLQQMPRLTSTRIALSPMSGISTTLRWIAAPVAGLIIAMGLLLFMQSLIETGEPVIQKIVGSGFVEFIRVRHDETVETRAEKPKKVMPEEMPEMLDPRVVTEQEAGAIVIGYSVSGPASNTMDFAGLIGDFGSPDGEFLPLVRVLPIYPQRARQRGMEGWVTLEFTITETGAVENVRVLESSDSIFERPAVRAVQKFKYRPRIHNGQPVAVTGVWYKITFQLDD